MHTTPRHIKLIECPRDAMQGWPAFIPTENKIAYQKALLKVGFDTIDFGSFVSPKAIPQMADTKDVLQAIQHEKTSSSLLAIIANVRGAEDAVKHEVIKYLGFPFSISDTFQQRNTNASIADALIRVQEIQEICEQHDKELVVYLSMGFGNPYGDLYHEDLVLHWAEKMIDLGVKIISIADTVGLAKPDQVYQTTSAMMKTFPHIETGVHLHADASLWKHKLDAAFEAGCNRYDGAINGIGGCPMAGNALVGNMNTDWMIEYFKEKNIALHLNEEDYAEAKNLASQIFI